MRKKSIFILLMLVFSMTSLAISNEELSSYDIAPGVIPGAGASAQSDEQWDLQYSYDRLEAQTGDNGLLGIAYDGTYLWVSGAGPGPLPPKIYLFNPWTGILEGEIFSGNPEQPRLRDLCSDGTNMYGGCELGLECWNIVSQNHVCTIAFPASMAFPRANAYDPVTDHFYCGNFGSMCYEQDRDGNLIRFWLPAPLNAIYGMAWDDDAPDGPWLWVHDQANPSNGCNVHQMDPATLTYTGFHISLNPPGSSNPIAGGLDYCWGIDPVFTSMLVLGQGNPDAGAAYEMYQDGYPSLSLLLTPTNPPVQIPAGGGSFDFDITIINTGSFAVQFDAWTRATLPDGSVVGPLLGPVNLTLTPGDSISRCRTQTVPANAPAGQYTYTGFVGIYPRQWWNYMFFYFDKLADSNGETVINEWKCWGETFFDEPPEALSALPGEFTLHNPFPNPFNQSTTIAYEIPEAGEINLTVYDVIGREVSELVNGYMTAGLHSAIWDASGRASGVYFCILNTKRQTENKKIILLK